MARYFAVCFFALDLGAGAMMDIFTAHWSVGIWIAVIVLALVGMGVCVWIDRKRKPKSVLGPEVRLNDTTTYREQPDGSRIVTQTTLAKPMRLAGRMHVTGTGTDKVSDKE